MAFTSISKKSLIPLAHKEPGLLLVSPSLLPGSGSTVQKGYQHGRPRRQRVAGSGAVRGTVRLTPRMETSARPDMRKSFWTMELCRASAATPWDSLLQ